MVETLMSSLVTVLKKPHAQQAPRAEAHTAHPCGRSGH